MLGFNLPRDDQKYQWTNHVKDKMLYYRISESLIKRIVRFPQRTEAGIAPQTIAVMQARTRHKNIRGKATKQTEEIWVMYQEIKTAKRRETIDDSKVKELLAISHSLMAIPKKRIISAWRYPGVSPINQPIPIPDEILSLLENGEIE